MGRNARATFSSNYLPFPLPLTVPSAGVSEGKLWSVCISDAWLPYVLGALKSLARPETWQGSDSDIQFAVQDAMTLIGEVREFCGVSPIGTIFAHACALAPANSLACDGSTYLRVDYPALYALLAAPYVTDADHFTVPDLRGRTVVGTGTGPGLTARVINDSGGEETHQLSTAEMPSHNHTVNEAAGQLTPAGLEAAILTAYPSPTFTGSRGSGTSHNNMQPWRALSYAIVAK